MPRYVNYARMAPPPGINISAAEAKAVRTARARRRIVAKKKSGAYKSKYALAKAIKKMPDSRPYVETKQITVGGTPTNMLINPLSAVSPLNSTVIVPPCFGLGLEQGNKQFNISGRAIFIRYLKMKMQIDLSPLKGDKLYNLRCIWGFCTTTLESKGHDTIVPTDYNAEVQLQLVKSGLLGAYTDFGQKRKSIKVLGDFQVRGNRNHSLAPQHGENMYPPQPIKNLSFNWPMGRKHWLVEGSEGNGTYHFNRSWIPFVSFHCPEFTGNAAGETPVVTLNSKMWFTDQ